MKDCNRQTCTEKCRCPFFRKNNCVNTEHLFSMRPNWTSALVWQLLVPVCFVNLSSPLPPKKTTSCRVLSGHKGEKHNMLGNKRAAVFLILGGSKGMSLDSLLWPWRSVCRCTKRKRAKVCFQVWQETCLQVQCKFLQQNSLIFAAGTIGEDQFLTSGLASCNRPDQQKAADHLYTDWFCCESGVVTANQLSYNVCL